MEDRRKDDEQAHAWLAAYRRGDVGAMGSLVEHFRRPLFAFVYRMCRDPGLAEEIFQEVWFKVIQHSGQYREKRFASWLFRIAHNLIVDKIRRSRPTAALDAPVGQDGASLHEILPSGGLSPSDQASAHDLRGRLSNAIASLPDDQREVFLLRTEGDVPFKEIARMQGVSLNTALGRMHYAVQKLREELAADYAAYAGGAS